MIYEILKYPAKELESPAIEVGEVTSDIIEKVDRMVETMYQNRGIGLAANQVGLKESIIVFDCSDEDDEPQCLINPKITNSNGSIVIEEGCLSFPGVTVHVNRFETIVVEYMDLNGNSLKKAFKDLESICVQHEIDHLEGKTFFSRINRQSRRKALKEMRRAK